MYYNKTYGSKLLVLLIVLSSLFVTSSSAMAHTHWREGIVTKAPWHERYYHITVDDKSYTFMPEASLSMRLKNHKGDYNQKKLYWSQIKIGDKVFINIQGRRIYRLIIQK